MKSLVLHTTQFILLTALLVFALGVNYLYAAWSGPPAGLPPSNCTPGYPGCDAPVNVGTAPQVKDGNLSVGNSGNATSTVGFSVVGRMYTTGWLKIGAAGGSMPAQPLDIRGVPGVDGIRFPDNSVQTTAFSTSTPQPMVMSFDRYMHVQGRIMANQTVSSGWSTRPLNTTLNNSIEGAAISGNNISLPAGTYYVEGLTSLFSTQNMRALFYNLSDATYGLLGTVAKPNGGGQDQGGDASTFSGIITLNAPKQFDVRTYASEAGYCLSIASITGYPDVCTDVRIWKLD